MTNNIFNLNDFILLIETIKFPKTYIFIESCICFLGIFCYFLSFIFWMTIYDKFNLIRENHNTFLLLYSISKFIKTNNLITRSYLMWIIYIILFSLLLEQYQTYIPTKKNNILNITIFSVITIPIYSKNYFSLTLIRFILLMIFLSSLFFNFYFEINKRITMANDISNLENEEKNFKRIKTLKIYKTLKITLILNLFFLFLKYILMITFHSIDFNLPRTMVKMIYNTLLIIEIIEVLSYFFGMSIITFQFYVDNHNTSIYTIEKSNGENSDENIELNVNIKNDNDNSFHSNSNDNSFNSKDEFDKTLTSSFSEEDNNNNEIKEDNSISNNNILLNKKRERKKKTKKTKKTNP